MPAPSLPPSILETAVGDYVNLYAQHEGSPAYDVGSFLTVTGVLLARRVSTYLGRPLYANLFTVLVGQTGLSRKTTAARRAVDFGREADRELDELGALSSAAGLVERLGGTHDDPKPPQHLIVMVEEMASLLRKSRQDGSRDLIPKLTELYDCPSIVDVPTRSRPVTAHQPTVALLGGTTQEWLENSLDEDDLHGGFVNRLTFVTGELRPPAPLPTPPDIRARAAIVRRLQGMVRNLPSEPVVFQQTKQAKELWIEFYSEWHSDMRSGSMLAGLSERTPDLALKVALVLAALRGGRQSIEVADLEPAIDFAHYSQACAQYLFKSISVGGSNPRVKLEKRTLSIVEEHGPISRSDLHRRIGGKTPAEDLKRTVQGLLDMNRLEWTRDRTPMLVVPDKEKDSPRIRRQAQR